MEPVDSSGPPNRKIRRIIVEDEEDKLINEEIVNEITFSSTPLKCYPKRVVEVLQNENIVASDKLITLTRDGDMFFAYLTESSIQISLRIEFNFVGTRAVSCTNLIY